METVEIYNTATKNLIWRIETMNNKNSKRALLTSVLSLAVCGSMLVGTTFAWFTDSVSSTNNVIKAGNLDVELEYATLNEEGAWEEYQTVKEDSILFGGEDVLYEPGYTEVVKLRVSNVGTLALKYQLGMTLVSETPSVNVKGEDFKLSDHIKVGGVEANMVTDRASAASYATKNIKEAAVLNYVQSPFGAIPANVLYTKEQYDNSWSSEWVFVVHMPENVGNEANYDKAVAEAPEMTIGVNLVATQNDVEEEEDGFGYDYDANASYPVLYFTEGAHTVASGAYVASGNATDALTAEGNETTVTIKGGTFDAADRDCAVWAKDGAKVIIEGGTFTCDGVGEELSSANHQDMIYAGTDGTIEIYGGFFYSKTATWLLNEKDNSGTIVVKGGTFVNWNPADNASEGANTDFVADGYTVEAKKVGDDTYYTVVVKADVWDGTVDTTWFNEDLVNSATVDAPVEIVIDTVEEFAGMVNLANTYTFKNVTIKLACDLDFTGINWNTDGVIGAYSSKFSGTLDGAGHKIINLSASNNWAYANGIFRTTGNDLTIKNFVVENANINNANTDRTSGNTQYAIFIGLVGSGTVTFENITIKNSSVQARGNAGLLVGGMTEGAIYVKNCRVENSHVVLTTETGLGGAFLGSGYSYHDHDYSGMFVDESSLAGVGSDCTLTNKDADPVVLPAYNYEK